MKKLKPKTTEEIQKEIAVLKEIKPKVRRYTAFGDDNWAKIDVQIEVLEEGLDEDEINDRYPDPEENSTAYETSQWRDGEEVDETPAAGWKELIRP